jgi:phenylpyruvate tautomerase PptA (4-oxalocrotonate tautomerase family)
MPIVTIQLTREGKPEQKAALIKVGQPATP